MKRLTLILCCFLSFLNQSYSQNDLINTVTHPPLTDSTVVEISGILSFQKDTSITAVPYGVVYIKGTERGTYSTESGIFSLAVLYGDTIIISHLSYKEIEIAVNSLEFKELKTILLVSMEEDVYEAPEIDIYPIPSKRFFKTEFLAMEVGSYEQDNANRNLNKEVLASIAAELPRDGSESQSATLSEIKDSYYYRGQIRPMPILDVIAWQKFIKGLINGEFKQK